MPSFHDILKLAARESASASALRELGSRRQSQCGVCTERLSRLKPQAPVAQLETGQVAPAVPPFPSGFQAVPAFQPFAFRHRFPSFSFK